MGGNCRRVLLGVGRETAGELYEPLQAHPELSVVGIVHDGRAVLESVVRAKPDVLVIDLVLPEFDGLAGLEHLASEAPGGKPKIVVLSSLSQDRIVAQVSAAGADYYVLKPCRPEIIIERILQLTTGRLPAPKVLSSPVGERPQMVRDHPGDVSRLLVEIGVPAHIKGYRFLQQAIDMVVKRVDLLSAVTKELYPAIAHTNGTTPSRVERAIRHAIEVAWARGDVACLQAIFGNTVNRERGKPTNSEFIALLADRLRPKAS